MDDLGDRRRDDDATLAALGAALADAVEEALPAWVAAALVDVPAVAVDRATADVLAAVVPPLRALLALDVDQQRAGPLAVIRTAAAVPTAVLRAAGAAPVERDDQQRALFPDDDYDMVPATWADLGPEVAEAGIAWGAAKAYVHRRRHRQASA